MPGPLWRDDETVVLIFFQSRKVCHEACRKLIERKCGTHRDLTGIRGRLASVRGSFGDLWNPTSRQWNLEAVDQWLLKQDVANVGTLTSLEPDDQHIIAEVSQAVPNQTSNLTSVVPGAHFRA